jgi:cytochrome c
MDKKNYVVGYLKAFLAAFFIVIFAILTANLLYQPKETVKRGFEIALLADGKAVKEEVKPVDLVTLLKTADFDRGAKISKKCASCHTFGKGEAAKVGPNLFGVIGRKRGSMSGFTYSKAMLEKGGAWDKESIDQFIAKPKDYLPGTKMGFAGLKKPQDRADVILFLESYK